MSWDETGGREKKVWAGVCVREEERLVYCWESLGERARHRGATEERSRVEDPRRNGAESDSERARRGVDFGG